MLAFCCLPSLSLFADAPLTAPSATPPATAEQAPAPAAEAAPSTRRRVRVRAQRQLFSPSLGRFQFDGAVEATTEALTIRAATLEYLSRDERIRASGDVSVQTTDGQTHQGQALDYQVRTGQWSFEQWTTHLAPETLGEPFIGPVYAQAERMSGDSAALRLSAACLTTCDRLSPHYALRADEVEIRPGDRLIARRVTITLGTRALVTLPWLSIPLNHDLPDQWPVVGQNAVEGYFLRWPIPYVLGARSLGVLRVDLTQKRGIGLGANHHFSVPGGEGRAFLYVNQGSRDYVARLEHAQQLPAAIALALNVGQRRDTSLTITPSITTDTSVTLTRPTEHSTTSLAVTQHKADGLYASAYTTAQFRHQARHTDQSLLMSSEFSQFGTPGLENATETSDLWNRLQWSRSLSAGQLTLRMDQHTALSSTAGMSGGLQRLPEITLATDPGRLLGIHARAVPSTLTLGWGLYAEGDQSPVGRTLLDWQVTPRPVTFGATTLSTYGGLRQGIYSAPASAQYLLTIGLTALTAKGPWSNAATYQRQAVHGFSPLNLDGGYASHSLTNNLQYQTPALAVYLTAGRDLQWTRWHDLTMRARATPSEALTLDGVLGYDPNSHRWRDLVTQLGWQPRPDASLSLQAYYDLEGQRMRQVYSSLQWTPHAGWALAWRGGYDGDRHRLQTDELRIVHDLHCWEASLVYQHNQRAIGFSLSPKALGAVRLPTGNAEWGGIE